MDKFFGNNNPTTPLNTGTGTGTTSATTSSGECKKQYVTTDSYGKLTACTPPSSWSNGFGLFGGRKKNCSMKRGGSFRPSSDLTTAAPFSGGKTAQSYNWTGGKRRRRSSKRRTRRFKCNKCSKRRRHRH